jgi:TetR/AcrR family tetracycline transcriptional repressor
VPSAGKINADAIAQAGLRLLNEVGLDGLTMRVLARELDVQAATLYWHLKNKQELLDAMAAIMLAEAAEGLEFPRRGVDWADWLAERCRQMRRTLLKYRDGARVFAGSATTDPLTHRTLELTLAVLQDAGFTIPAAARGFPTLLHYTVGFTIEEQAQSGQAYVGSENPYQPDRMATAIDASRFPLAAQARCDLFGPDTDAAFDHGLKVILAGLEFLRQAPDPAPRT